MALVTYQGKAHTGLIDFVNGESFTGPTIDAPGEVPNAEGWIFFDMPPSGVGPSGSAVIEEKHACRAVRLRRTFWIPKDGCVWNLDTETLAKQKWPMYFS